MLESFLSMVDQAFDPTKGQGIMESITSSILAIMLVLSLCMALFIPFDSQVLQSIIIFVTAIAAFYFGKKTEQYKTN